MSQALRRALRVVAVLAAAAAVLGRPAAGQSLAELARKEEERRKTLKSAPAAAKDAKDKEKDTDKDRKVFTNKDLPPSEPPAASPPASVPADAAANPGAQGAQQEKPPPPAAEPPPPRDEKHWRTLIESARGDIQRQQLFLDALQNRLNALDTDYVSRDDSARRAAAAAERQKTLAGMEAARKEIARLQKHILDIEEEARKAGVPAGWVR